MLVTGTDKISARENDSTNNKKDHKVSYSEEKIGGARDKNKIWPPDLKSKKRDTTV